ncbi:aminotransferase-like domain-containing protein [Acetobacter persici]|nr:PLP-dependent aminotransferase family protein [Acetobacter persici]
MHASEIRELLKLLDQPDIISFAGGIPDPDLFPKADFADAFSDLLNNSETAAQALQYSVSEGYLPLRVWIAEFMGTRGVACTADNILITSGSQQALDFLGKLFLSPGDTAFVSAPTYLGALQAFNAYQPRYDTLPACGSNQNAEHLRDMTCKAESRPALAYCVPDFANPTGITLSCTEREKLLTVVQSLDIPLIEDAAYEALRFEGTPEPSCLALEIAQCGTIEKARTLYCGTFSKTLAPALRIGWCCGARSVIDKLVLVKQAADLHTATLNQMALHQVLMRDYTGQLERLRRTYQKRRDTMLDALKRFMPDGVTWTRPEGGMFIWLTLPSYLDAAACLGRAIAEKRVAFVPGSAFYSDGSGQNTLRLSFSLQTDRKIEDGIQRLASLVREMMA